MLLESEQFLIVDKATGQQWVKQCDWSWSIASRKKSSFSPCEMCLEIKYFAIRPYISLLAKNRDKILHKIIKNYIKLYKITYNYVE